MPKNKLFILPLLFSSSIISCFSSAERYTPQTITDSSIDSVNTELISEEIKVVDYSNKPKYTVSFFSVIGTTEFCCAVRTVVEGEQVEPPKDFAKEGRVLDGWYLEREYINLFDFSDPIYADTSIYAKWQGDYVFSEFGSDAYSIIGYSSTDEEVNLVLPSSFSGKPIINIGSDAFANNKTIKEIKVPSSITTINDRAFYNCSNLEKVSFPTNLKRIGSDAFAYCTSLDEVLYANTIASWSNIDIYESKLLTRDGYIFKNCNSFKTLASTPKETTKISLTDYLEYSQINFSAATDVTHIKKYTYCYLSQLTSVSVSNPNFNSFGEYSFASCPNLEQLIVSNVEKAKTEEGSFYNCVKLNSITGSSLFSEIGGYTFYNCNRITTFYFSTTLEKVNAYSFYNTGLSSVIFNNSYAIEAICSYAFASCSSITEVGLKVVSYIQSYAFYNCSGISNFYYAGSSTTLTNKKNSGYYSTLGNDNLFNATISYEG